MHGSNYFEDWGGLLRVIVIGIAAYTMLVVILRISGKRTLSKMNAFDLVVTVALGSTLATIILSKDVALAEGILALCLLIGLQYAVTWSSVRWKTISKLVKSDPTLLFYGGEFLQGNMSHSRVVEEEVVAAVRHQRIGSMREVEAVVLESDCTIAVVKSSEYGMSALRSIPGVQNH